MPKVVGLRFRTSPKMYWFAPIGEDEQYVKGAAVIVETQRGMEIATVVMPPREVDESEIVAPLKEVTRMATDDEVKAVRVDDDQKRDILSTAKQKVLDRKLEMKIVDCEYTIDRSKLVLYFTAEQRVDFRELVRDLASAFHMRIDLRQISARDECKLIGALGGCGMPCCCGGFESDNAHVSIKMAKNQNLALTPNKINGMCGRLLCCLGYENKTYEEVLKRAPKHGSFVTAPDGRRGIAVSVTPLTEMGKVKFEVGENFEFAEFPMSELKYERREEEQKPDGGEQKRNDNNQKQNNKKKNKNNNNRNNTNQNNRNNNNNNQNNNNQNNNNQNNNRKNGDKRKDKKFDKKKNGEKQAQPENADNKQE